MKYIELTKGKQAIVDDEDFEWLNQWSWCYDSHGYAVRGGSVNWKKYRVSMHGAILKAPKGMVVDHINQNTLDNRRCNLRIATKSQNALNSKLTHRDNKIGFRGVSAYPGGFYARLYVRGKKYYAAGFRSPEDAARAYDAMALKVIGPNAVVNFPEKSSLADDRQKAA